MSVRQLTLSEAEFIAHELARVLMDSEKEPMPPFSTRYPGKLESCLGEPFQTFDGKYLHRTFVEKAAVLFYLITKNHCFENGNKRMAVTLTMVFCYVNNRWLDISSKELYQIACDVAESDPKSRDRMHEVLALTFGKYMTNNRQASI